MKVGSIWCNMSFVWKYCLNLERTSSQLLSDWSRHCCQASSLVLQECVDQSERLTDCSKKMWQNRRRFCCNVHPALPTAAGAVPAVETLLIIVVSGRCHVGGGTKHVCIYFSCYQYYYQCFSVLNIVIYREISLTPLQADDTSCQFSRDWADTGNKVTRARDKRQ